MAAPVLEFNAGLNIDGINAALGQLRGKTQDELRQINAALGGTVTKQIILETKTDERGAKGLLAVEKERLSVVDKLIKEQQKLDSVQAGSATSLRQQVNQAKQARDALAKYKEGTDSIGRSVRIVSDQWVEQNKKVKSLEGQLSRVDGSPFWDRLKENSPIGPILNFGNGLSQLTNQLQAAQIIIGQVIGSFNDLIDAIAKLQTFSLSFKAIGAGVSGAQQALAESSRIALNLGVGLQNVRNSFQQLTPVILNSGGSLQNVSDITETLSSRFAAFGISGDRARRVTNGIIQAFAKGKLQAEELTQQIAEADPAFGTDFAKALGVSTAELLRMVKAGEINTKVLLDTIPQLSKSSLLYGKLGTSAGDAVVALASGNATIDQVRNKFDSLNQLSFEKLAKAAGPIIFSILELQATFSDLFAQISESGAFQALNQSLGIVLQSFSKLVKLFATISTGALVVLEPLGKLVEFLLKIPVAAELIGLYIASRMLQPLVSLKSQLLAATATTNNFAGKTVRAAATFENFGRSIQSVSGNIKAAFIGASQAGANQAALISRLAKREGTLTAAQAFGEARISGLQQRLTEENKALAQYQRNVQAWSQTQRQLLRYGRTEDARLPGQLAQQSSANFVEQQNKIRRTEAELNRQQQALARTNVNLASTSAAYTRLTSNSGLLSRATRGVGSAFGALRAGATGLVSALGPLGIAMIAFGVIQEGYTKGMAQSREEAEKAKTAVLAYKEALSSQGIQVGEGEEKKINILAQAWEAASVAIASSLQRFTKVDPFSALTENFKENASLYLAFAVGNLSAETATQKLKLKTDEVAKSLQNSGKWIQYNTNALRNFAKSQEFKTGEGQLKAIAIYKKTQEAIAISEDQVTSFKEELERLEKQFAKDGSPRLKEQIEETRRKLKEINDEFIRQKGILIELAKEIGIEKAIQATVSSIEALNERLKSAQNNLRDAAPDTTGFRVASATVAATEKAIEKLIDKTKDPVTISVGLDLAEQDNIRRFEGLQNKLRAELDKPTGAQDPKVIIDLRTGIGKLRRDIENIRELRIEVNADSLNNASAKIAKLEKEIGKLDISAPSLPGLIASLNATQASLEALRSYQRDPIVLEIITNRRLTEKNKELKKLLDKNKEDIRKFNESPDNQVAIKQKLEVDVREGQRNIALVRRELEALRLSSGKLNVINEVNRLEFKSQLQKLQSEANLTTTKLSTSIVFPKTREIQSKIEEIQSQISQLSGKRLQIQTKLQDPSLAPAQRQALLREQVLTTQQIANAAREGTTTLIDAAAKLRQELQGAQVELLKIIQQGEQKGFPVGQATRSFAQEVEAELNARLQAIVASREVRIEFQGTRDEILAAKLELVDFYDRLEKAENNIGDTITAGEIAQSAVKSLAESGADPIVSSIAKSIGSLVPSTDKTKTNSESITNNFSTAADAARDIVDSLLSLNNTVLTVYIKEVRIGGNRWAGGPVLEGWQYPVNEKGKEGFLSVSGDMSPINKPANSLWRAPSSGTVIPAHIWSKINAPDIGTTVRPPSAVIGGIGHGSSTVTGTNRLLIAEVKDAMNEIAKVQAHQARQIGKLASAVGEFARKDWDIHVGVHNSGNTAYLDSLNRFA